MDESKTTRSVGARKVVVAALAASNQTSLPPQQNVINPTSLVRSHMDQVRASQVARSIPINSDQFDGDSCFDSNM